MKLQFWPQDTIAYRFGATIAASIVITGFLIGIFFVFGGVWAQHPMDAAAHLKGGRDVVRMLEATPHHLRTNFSEKEKENKTYMKWYNSSSQMAASLEMIYNKLTNKTLTNKKYYSEEVKSFSKDIHRIAFTVTPEDIIATELDSPIRSALHENSYNLVIKLNDGSWFVSGGVGRDWGLSYFQLLCVWISFCIFSFALVGFFMARQCARPFERVAQAIRKSGLNPLSPPISQDGPKELKIIAAAFNDMQKQIQDLIDTRTFMLAAISHDLRTPLTRIRLRSEYIEDRTQRAKLRLDVDEMQTMIDAALSFFRGDTSGETERPFDLAGILESIADDYEDRNIQIAYDGPSSMTYVGRPLALKRAFTNLIENAVKYATPPTVALVSQAEGLAVTIRDHGPGIPDEEMDKVFKPYFRLDKSRNLATGGIGLGLTIAQTIVRRHGGDITLRNHPSGGLEATVLLPWPPGVDGS